ncbi:MAG: hypothetical protein JXB48_10410 [Candidatus Latescibacteria bacterium]|nr:hypothetical protein [Candidatus Latescibacterota bacterium]
MKRISSYVIIFTSFIILSALITFIGCEGPQGPEGPMGLSADPNPGQCGTCHNVSTVILAKQIQYQESGHAQGEAYLRSTSAGCAPCHSNEGFRMKIAGEEVVGIDNPTPQNCRTCHNIHTNFTQDDFMLSTTLPVELTGIMYNGDVVDFGAGNLCANCHQSRPRDGLVLGGDDVKIDSAHWGPHHGTQSNILAGSGGFELAGPVEYLDSGHTKGVADGCVACHLSSHSLVPNVKSCEACHPGIKDFDYEGVQSEVTALLDELEDILIEAGLLSEKGDLGTVSGVTVSSTKAGALLNYLMVAEDGSHGVHNANYTKALLKNSIAAF